MPAQNDYYGLLGIAPGASQEEIREAFLERAVESHPDGAGGSGTQEKMIALSQAVEILADPRKREVYDRARAHPNDPITAAQLQAAEEDAASRARMYPQNPEDFSTWFNAIAADVQRTTGGRILSGLVAGAVFGIIGGCIISYFMSINVLIGGAFGLVAGALGGAFAAASNDPAPTRQRIVR